MVKSYAKAVILIIVLFFIITFAVKNSGGVEVSYYFGLFYADVPLWMAMYAWLVIGGIVGLLWGLTKRFTLKKRLRAAEKELKEMRAELELLRSKAAVPVYSETIYVPTPKPAPEDDHAEHEVKHISDAY